MTARLRWPTLMLGVIWCAVGISKLLTPDRVAYALLAHRLKVSAKTISVGYSILSLVELSIGILLAARPVRRVGAQSSLVLASVFLVHAAWAGSGADSCACLGRWLHLSGLPRFGLAALLLGASYLIVRYQLPEATRVRGSRSRVLPP